MTDETPEIAESHAPHLIRETFPVGPLRCNCSVLGDPDTLEGIVIDPGGDVQRIVAVLVKHNLRLTGIVVTHAHLDHIAGAASLRALTGAPVLYHEADLELVALMDQQAAWMGVPTPEVKPPDESIGTATELGLGRSTLRVLHTPGHTPGVSACTLRSTTCSWQATRSSRAAWAAQTCGAATPARYCAAFRASCCTFRRAPW